MDPLTDATVPHHRIAAAAFASDRFWDAADQLAERTGHVEHSLQLHGETERDTLYKLRCLTCQRSPNVPVGV